ncbi:hypothetical protein [Mongoliibacter sp.]|uniref:hypothetical protein n=1 Tax=Mongoliibacter sp. TaxID=2022438 RepID=UPI0025DDD511|nr:hypothetical protein [Mongoliibacter sp.]
MGQSLNNEVVQFEFNKTLAWQFHEKKIQGMHAWVIIPKETDSIFISARPFD